MSAEPGYAGPGDEQKDELEQGMAPQIQLQQSAVERRRWRRVCHGLRCQCQTSGAQTTQTPPDGQRCLQLILMSLQALVARQKDELEQSTARQTELQHAAVDREAAAQDLWVRLEAERGALAEERERGAQSAVQLAAALQQMEVCMIRQDVSPGI